MACVFLIDRDWCFWTIVQIVLYRPGQCLFLCLADFVHVLTCCFVGQVSEICLFEVNVLGSSVLSPGLGHVSVFRICLPCFILCLFLEANSCFRWILIHLLLSHIYFNGLI